MRRRMRSVLILCVLLSGCGSTLEFPPNSKAIPAPRITLNLHFPANEKKPDDAPATDVSVTLPLAKGLTPVNQVPKSIAPISVAPFMSPYDIGACANYRATGGSSLVASVVDQGPVEDSIAAHLKALGYADDGTVHSPEGESMRFVYKKDPNLIVALTTVIDSKALWVQYRADYLLEPLRAPANSVPSGAVSVDLSEAATPGTGGILKAALTRSADASSIDQLVDVINGLKRDPMNGLNYGYHDDGSWAIADFHYADGHTVKVVANASVPLVTVGGKDPDLDPHHSVSALIGSLIGDKRTH